MDQMRDDKVHRLCGCELRQGQHRLQQLAYVSGRQRWQDLDFQLVRQCGITCIHLRPHQLRLGDEPQCGRGERQMMLPGPILLGLEFVPANLRLGILKGALGEGAAATPRDQTGLGGVRRGIEQRIRAVTIAIARLTNHALRGLWPAATVQIRRTAQSAVNHPRSVRRTCTRSHTVCGCWAKARTSWGRWPLSTCSRVGGRPRLPRFGGRPTRGSLRYTNVSAGTWAAYRTPSASTSARNWLSRPYSASQASRSKGKPWSLTRLTIFNPNWIFVSKRRSAGIPRSGRLWAT